MTIASAQTMAVPAGVTLTQETDWARNAIKLTARYQDRESSTYITNEVLRRMDRLAFQGVVDQLVARVMTIPKLEPTRTNAKDQLEILRRQAEGFVAQQLFDLGYSLDVVAEEIGLDPWDVQMRIEEWKLALDDNEIARARLAGETLR